MQSSLTEELSGRPTRDRSATTSKGWQRASRLSPSVHPVDCQHEHTMTAARTRFAKPGQGDPMPYVFDFDHTHARPPMELKDLLGGKGANLAEMTSVLALPVPPG